MSDDLAKAAIEAARGSVRLAMPHFKEIYQEDHGDAEPTQATVDAVVQKMRSDPELSRVFRPKVPQWEDLKTRKDKADFVDQYGVDAFLDLSRRAHLK